jgi:hypothetical protein
MSFECQLWAISTGAKVKQTKLKGTMSSKPIRLIYINLIGYGFRVSELWVRCLCVKVWDRPQKIQERPSIGFLPPQGKDHFQNLGVLQKKV